MPGSIRGFLAGGWRALPCRRDRLCRGLEIALPLGKLLGDVPAATAILDRFLHNAEVLSITGKSYRPRNRSAKEPPPAEAAACMDEQK
jgi:hypothetical protein